MVTYETSVQRTVKVSVPYTTDLFGETRYRVEKRKVVEKITYEAPEYPAAQQHIPGLKYLIALKENVVTSDEIKKASERAGPLFVEMKGEVIPLRDPQREFMKTYSPELYREYEAHYQNIFNCLYAA